MRSENWIKWNKWYYLILVHTVLYCSVLVRTTALDTCMVVFSSVLYGFNSLQSHFKWEWEVHCPNVVCAWVRKVEMGPIQFHFKTIWLTPKDITPFQRELQSNPDNQTHTYKTSLSLHGQQFDVIFWRYTGIIYSTLLIKMSCAVLDMRKKKYIRFFEVVKSPMRHRKRNKWRKKERGRKEGYLYPSSFLLLIQKLTPLWWGDP